MSNNHLKLSNEVSEISFDDSRIKAAVQTVVDSIDPNLPLFKRQRIFRFCKFLANQSVENLTWENIQNYVALTDTADFTNNILQLLYNNGLYAGKLEKFSIPVWHLKNAPFKDEKMRNIMIQIDKDDPKVLSTKGAVDLKRVYASLSTSDIDWIKVCQDAADYSAWQLAFFIIYQALKQNLYQGSKKEKLIQLMPYFDDIYSGKYKPVGQDAWNFMCGERLDGLHIYRNSNSSLSYIIMEVQNPYIYEEYIEWSKLSVLSSNISEDKDFVWNFERSFSKKRHSIHNLSGFNSETFWLQINYYKHLFCGDRKRISKAVSGVCDFYRTLVRNNEDFNPFTGSTTMSYALLFSQGLNRRIVEDYTFMTWQPNMSILKPYNHVVLLLNGLDRFTSKLEKEDWRDLDFSQIKSDFYKELLLRYIVRNLGRNTALITGSIVYLYLDFFNFLYRMKSNPIYPNKNEANISNQEAILYRNYIMGKQSSIANKSTEIQHVKQFLQWCKETDELNLEDMVLYYLMHLPVVRKNNATSIPDADLQKIIKYVINDSTENQMARLAYPIIRLQLETEFRIGTIVSLKTDCIRPTMKPNQFRIRVAHKTSNGELADYVISSDTYRTLMNVIEDTEPLRDQCVDKQTAEYIFLRNGTMGIANIRVPDYTNYLTQVCKMVGCPVYTASNFRDTHMTKALEWAIREEKSDVELSILTSHKNIDTTKNNYIDWKMEELLEATYGLDLSESDYLTKQFNVTNQIPSQFSNGSNVVEGGCGICTANTCHVKNEIPCLLCADFITTVDHEIFFRKAIDRIDRLIEVSHSHPHDVEDLITMKKLYVLYLGKILERKEDLNDGSSSSR